MSRRCRSKVELIQLGSAHEKYGVWKARLYVNFIALRKYDFLDSFFVLFSVQNLCCNDSDYHSLNWQDVSATNVHIFEKKQFSLHFSLACFRVNVVYRVSFIFRLNAFLVSVCTKGFSYLLCWPRGKGLLVCTNGWDFRLMNFTTLRYLIF